MVPALDILSQGHCYKVCYLQFRVRHPQLGRLLNCLLSIVPVFDILSYGHCYNICYLQFRRQTSLVTAIVKMLVIYGSGVRHSQLGRTLNCLLSIVPALDILSYCHCYNVCYIWFWRQTSIVTVLLTCWLSMVPALDILSQDVS